MSKITKELIFTKEGERKPFKIDQVRKEVKKKITQTCLPVQSYLEHEIDKIHSRLEREREQASILKKRKATLTEE